MVSIEQVNGKILVTTPYSPDFPPSAKQLGGRWDAASRAWSFAAAQEARVRDLCRDVYGTDGSADVQTCTLRVELSRHLDTKSLVLCGRPIARVHSRDGGARLGDGVAVVDGRLSSGGSRANPRLDATEGTVVEISDVPVLAAEALTADLPADVISATILTAEVADREALRAEGLAVLARLREIEAALGEVLI